MLLRVEDRRMLWVLSTQVLQEKCPCWLETGTWGATFPGYDKLGRVREPYFRALRTIVSLLHGGPPPSPDRFDCPFVKDLADLRGRLNLGAVINPWIQNLLRHLCRDGGRYIMDLPDWPLLIPLCARFESQQQFDLVCRRFIRNCQVDERNLPHCHGITFSKVKSANWCRSELHHAPLVFLALACRGHQLTFLAAFPQTTSSTDVSASSTRSWPSCRKERPNSRRCPRGTLSGAAPG